MATTLRGSRNDQSVVGVVRTATEVATARDRAAPDGVAPRALPVGRLAAPDATRGFHHGLLALGLAFVVSGTVVVRAASQEPARAEGGRSVLDGVFTTEQASRGEQTFKQACTACHTLDKMTGNRFRAKWAEGSVGDVFDFMSNAMPEGDPGSLMPAEYASIVAFFLRASGYPAGERELPTDKAELAQLRIVPLPK